MSSEQEWWAGGIHDCPDNGLEYVIYTRSESGGDLIVAFATGEKEREQIIADHNARLPDVQQDANGWHTCPVCQDYFYEQEGIYYSQTCSKDCARLIWQSHNMTMSVQNLDNYWSRLIQAVEESRGS